MSSASLSSSSSGFAGEDAGGSEDYLHVLAVDDNSVDRMLIERLLKRLSCRVTTVENGKRALEVLENQNNLPEMKVNVIFTDYCMPEVTGFDLLKRVKGSSALREIPVVVMSSENNPTRINRCLEEGAEEFLLKPVSQLDVLRLHGRFMRTNHFN